MATLRTFAPPFDNYLLPSPPKLRGGHKAISEKLAAHAEPLLKQSERRLASESVWGVAAHAVRAFARKRGWPVQAHSDYGVIADWIAKQSGLDLIAVYQAALEEAHRNFYGDRQDAATIRRLARAAQSLVALLEEAERIVPEDAEPPADREYRKQALRLLSKWGTPARPSNSLNHAPRRRAPSDRTAPRRAP